MIRLAIVGLGGIAQSVHLPIIQRNRADIDLVAAVELSPSRLATLADRYAISPEGRFTDLDALVVAVNEERLVVDAAIIATGGGHTDEALALIRAGIRVLVEKPLGWNPTDLDALTSGLSAIGLDADDWLRIGYMKEHDPAVAAARTLLDGVTPREVRIEVLHPADQAQLHFARLASVAADADPSASAALDERAQHSIDEALGTDDPTLRKLWTNVILGSVIHDIALTRHLGLGLDRVLHARRIGDEFPGSVLVAGLTVDDVPWNLSWHFITDYPEYREQITVHHERGTVQLEFATPYILNAPTVLRVYAGGPEYQSQVTEQTWPQEEAFERQLHALLSMTRGDSVGGSSLPAARRDLASAQALWRACATSAGINTDPGSGDAEIRP